ncbi:hypothetical protein EVG20_g10558 [Dentipellis fragilis]|uniref:Uncharacterized protein n=1 Tax=Dentipellis fragilis TaxID=205917 RepID=A0A4Y9XQQ7_9AGAM|nr:hypothetical protein EVG20_g10558 [Dentipellis fragilis]
MRGLRQGPPLVILQTHRPTLMKSGRRGAPSPSVTTAQSCGRPDKMWDVKDKAPVAGATQKAFLLGQLEEGAGEHRISRRLSRSCRSHCPHLQNLPPTQTKEMGHLWCIHVRASAATTATASLPDTRLVERPDPLTALLPFPPPCKATLVLRVLLTWDLHLMSETVALLLLAPGTRCPTSIVLRTHPLITLGSAHPPASTSSITTGAPMRGTSIPENNSSSLATNKVTSVSSSISNRFHRDAFADPPNLSLPDTIPPPSRTSLWPGQHHSDST